MKQAYYEGYVKGATYLCECQWRFKSSGKQENRMTEKDGNKLEGCSTVSRAGVGDLQLGTKAQRVQFWYRCAQYTISKRRHYNTVYLSAKALQGPIWSNMESTTTCRLSDIWMRGYLYFSLWLRCSKEPILDEFFKARHVCHAVWHEMETPLVFQLAIVWRLDSKTDKPLVVSKVAINNTIELDSLDAKLRKIHWNFPGTYCKSHSIPEISQFAIPFWT